MAFEERRATGTRAAHVALPSRSLHRNPTRTGRASWGMSRSGAASPARLGGYPPRLPTFFLHSDVVSGPMSSPLIGPGFPELLPPAMNASAESRCYQGLRVSTRRSVNNPAQPHQPWNCSRLKGQTTLSTTIRLGWSSRTHRIQGRYTSSDGRGRTTRRHGSSSRLISNAGAECVIAPTDMKSTLVFATARTVASVIPPDASVRARPRAISTT